MSNTPASQPNPSMENLCCITVVLTDSIEKLAAINEEYLEEYFCFPSDYEQRYRFVADVAMELSRLPGDAYPLFDLCDTAAKMICAPPTGSADAAGVVLATENSLKGRDICL